MPFQNQKPPARSPWTHLIALLLGAGAAVAVAVPVASSNTSTVTHPAQLGPPHGEASDTLPSTHRVNGQGPASPVTFHAASGCGIERWSIKTGTDPGAAQVNLTPQDASVTALGAIPPPLDPTDRVAPTETTVFHVTATVTAVKEEADSDYHLALSDGQGHTMIAESPDPQCASGSQFASQLQQVRDTINQACPNIGPSYQDVSIPAELTGVGLFDRIHGQRGVAPNGIELHPLLAIKLNGQC